MAVSTSSAWFQSWSPPNHLGPVFTQHFVDHSEDVRQPWKDDNQNRHGGSRYHRPSTNVADVLPYFLGLSLVTPSPGSSNLRRAKTLEPLERTGPFKTWYAWNEIDFEYASDFDRDQALNSKEYVKENNLPLGLEVYGDRLFISFPKWKKGVPVTLAVLPKYPKERSPKLVPYPNWELQNGDVDCDSMTSVYRMQADECGRLWVIDSGQVEVTIKPKQVCPPKLYIFDLLTDKLLLRYPLPEPFIKQDSLYSNIKVDIRDGKCDDAYAYIADVWRFGLVVFSLKDMKSWRLTDHLFYPDPLASAYNVEGLDFEWQDGIFGMALSPVNKKTNDRILYWHPMSSFREFYAKTSVIRNETGWDKIKDAFKVLGQSRGSKGHASASAMDRNGILFYNEVTRNSIACWDSRKPYKRDNLGVVARSSETIVFPNDMKIDKEAKQSIWVLSNKLPIYLYKGLKKTDINFRIMSAYTDEAVKDTICDPYLSYGDSYDEFKEVEDCY